MATAVCRLAVFGLSCHSSAMYPFIPNLIFGRELIAVILAVKHDPQLHDVNHG